MRLVVAYSGISRQQTRQHPCSEIAKAFVMTWPLTYSGDVRKCIQGAGR